MNSPFVSIRDHTVLSHPLSNASFVIDAGSNAGHFAHAMVQRFGCKVLALEPTPSLAASFPVHEHIELVQAALAAADGSATFHISDNPEASSIGFAAGVHTEGSVEVLALSLETVLNLAPEGRADLVKMDIEGSEIEVLQGASDALLRRIGQLSVEFHDFMGHNTRSVSEACIDRVRRAGFHVHRYRRSTADVLFLNHRVCSSAGLLRAKLMHALAVRLRAS